MTIMNSIPRTLISRHSSLVPRHINNVGVNCRRYHGLSRASSSAALDVGVDSSTAATQPIFIATTTPAGQSLHFKSIVNYSTIINSLTSSQNDAYSSSRRSMVTVTQTSAKSSEELDNNNTAAAPIIQHSSTSTDNSNSSEDSSLTITPTCAARIQQLASTKPNPDKVYLRLYVDAGGCSGFQYKFLLLSEDNDIDTDTNNIEEEEEEEEDGTIDPEEDIIFHNTNGTRLVIDTTSLDLLRGSTIDYVQEMIRSSFAVVGNPQSESACGCGSSFAVKNFEANPALD